MHKSQSFAGMQQVGWGIEYRQISSKITATNGTVLDTKTIGAGIEEATTIVEVDEEVHEETILMANNSMATVVLFMLADILMIIGISDTKFSNFSFRSVHDERQWENQSQGRRWNDNNDQHSDG